MAGKQWMRQEVPGRQTHSPQLGHCREAGAQRGILQSVCCCRTRLVHVRDLPCSACHRDRTVDPRARAECPVSKYSGTSALEAAPDRDGAAMRGRGHSS
jgi:hypothetical protein